VRRHDAIDPGALRTEQNLTRPGEKAAVPLQKAPGEGETRQIL
jgi:hypothetical protein